MLNSIPQRKIIKCESTKESERIYDKRVARATNRCEFLFVIYKFFDTKFPKRIVKMGIVSINVNIESNNCLHKKTEVYNKKKSTPSNRVLCNAIHMQLFLFR